MSARQPFPPGYVAKVLARTRQRLSTDAGMAAFMDRDFGVGNWAYDPEADWWVGPNTRHTGPGRSYVVFVRGGDWHICTLPDEASS